MKAKKVLGLMLVIAVTAAFLAGCGGKGEGGKKQEDKGAANTATKSLGKFETIDSNGKKVTQDIFKKYKYTVVDAWGTFCGPCIRSLPDLEKMRANFEKQGYGVLGIVVDAKEATSERDPVLERAAKLLKEANSKMVSIAPYSEFANVIGNEISSVPTQFLVDSKGNIVSELYPGGLSEKQWLDMIKKISEGKAE